MILIERQPISLIAKVPQVLSTSEFFNLKHTELRIRYSGEKHPFSIMISFFDMDGRKIQQPVALDNSGYVIYTMDTSDILVSTIFKNIEFTSSINFDFELWVEEVEVNFGSA